MAFEQKVVDLTTAEAAQLGDALVNTVHLLVGMLLIISIYHLPFA